MLNEKKIVIVDDHALFRKGLAALINLFPGYTLLYDASNGKDFIEKIMQSPLPNVILMDIAMPEMDGYATTEWLHQHYPDIKVIALSTMDAETAIIKMIRCGAKGYVLKDVDPDELWLALNEVLNRGYFYNEHITRKVMHSISELTESNNHLSLFAKLSSREVEFLKLICSELTYKEIAARMFLSVRTVEGYRDNLCEKLDLKTRIGLAIYAIKNNLVKL